MTADNKTTATSPQDVWLKGYGAGLSNAGGRGSDEQTILMPEGCPYPKEWNAGYKVGWDTIVRIDMDNAEYWMNEAAKEALANG